MLKNSLHRAIQKVATGPEYSKNLTYDEALEVMTTILSGDADPVQSGIFFIALRMKRETDEENRGILQAIRNANLGANFDGDSDRAIVDIDNLIDLSDPYNGYVRGVPASPFLPAVFSAAGYPCIAHGMLQVAPKFGVTPHRILKAAGKNVALSIDQVKANLESEAIGWSYLDQSVYCPALHDLASLRQRMVKRQVITTVEALAQPLRARGKTHMMSGYVHKAYPAIYADLARHAGFDNMVLIRGVEGGVVASLKQQGRFFSYVDFGEETLQELDPTSIGLLQKTRNVPLPAHLADIEKSYSEPKLDELAKYAADAGLRALAGEAGPTRDSLVYSAAIMLHFLTQNSLAEAANVVRGLLDSGSALAMFNQHP
ncbi:MAG: anthranilate phosphoribosyltransferase [Gammaproteobacteria bacterium]|jgi:anthranilate phosphoribosyltransferase